MYLTFGVISSTVTWKMADCHQSTHFVRQIVAETIWRIQNVRKLIARKSALEKTQLSDVLITDNLF